MWGKKVHIPKWNNGKTLQGTEMHFLLIFSYFFLNKVFEDISSTNLNLVQGVYYTYMRMYK